MEIASREKMGSRQRVMMRNIQLCFFMRIALFALNVLNTEKPPERWSGSSQIIQVANLPEKFRMPIHLYYSADMSIREIAEILKVPEGTVKSRMNKAKSLLKKELEALGYDR